MISRKQAMTWLQNHIFFIVLFIFIYLHVLTISKIIIDKLFTLCFYNLDFQETKLLLITKTSLRDYPELCLLEYEIRLAANLAQFPLSIPINLWIFKTHFPILKVVKITRDRNLF